jgi:hypothetical protein
MSSYCNVAHTEAVRRHRNARSRDSGNQSVRDSLRTAVVSRLRRLRVPLPGRGVPAVGPPQSASRADRSMVGATPRDASSPRRERLGKRRSAGWSSWAASNRLPPPRRLPPRAPSPGRPVADGGLGAVSRRITQSPRLARRTPGRRRRAIPDGYNPLVRPSAGASRRRRRGRRAW